MEIKELGHVVLFVKDMARSQTFYRDILGFHEVISAPGMAMFSSGRTHHELLLIEVGKDAPAPAHGRRAGLYHIGFKIGDSLDDVRAARETLLEKKVTIVGMSDHHVTFSLYILDPDGNELELYADNPAADWRANPLAVAAPTRPLAL